MVKFKFKMGRADCCLFILLLCNAIRYIQLNYWIDLVVSVGFVLKSWERSCWDKATVLLQENESSLYQTRPSQAGCHITQTLICRSNTHTLSFTLLIHPFSCRSYIFPLFIFRLSSSHSMCSTWRNMTRTMTSETGLGSSASSSFRPIRVELSANMPRSFSLPSNLHLYWSLHLKVK